MIVIGKIPSRFGAGQVGSSSSPDASETEADDEGHREGDPLLGDRETPRARTYTDLRATREDGSAVEQRVPGAGRHERQAYR